MQQTLVNYDVSPAKLLLPDRGIQRSLDVEFVIGCLCWRCAGRLLSALLALHGTPTRAQPYTYSRALTQLQQAVALWRLGPAVLTVVLRCGVKEGSCCGSWRVTRNDVAV